MSITDGQARRVVAGRYVLRGLLGKGGMADVELAYDEVLDRQVAVKMLHTQYATNDEFVDRFRREAQAAAALNHPNVVAVYDTGTDSNGRPYIVMEYVAGRTLREILKTDVINPQRAAEIAAEAAEALKFAHDRGIIHRDIKPGNIMIADDGRVKVCDYGIARAANAESITQTSSVFGTAAYVAPEQAQGRKVDGRTDLYSLGCVLFEMLTGRQPYMGDTPVSLAYKHVSEAPPMPRSLNPEIPPALEAVTLKAMEKDPEKRYANGSNFAADLRKGIEDPNFGGAPTQSWDERTQINYPDDNYDPTIAYTDDDYVGDWDQHYEDTSSSSIAKVLAIIVAIACLVAGGLFLWSRFNTPDIPQIQVPNIAGKPFAEAQQDLIDQGLQPSLGESQSSDTVESNHVITTDPVAGTEVEKGSTVLMILSTGPDSVAIPALSRMTRAQAEELLTSLELKVGNVTREPSTSIDKGLVISSQPNAGTSVSRGSSITLVVSSGGETFKMPNLTDLTEVAAREAITRLCGSPTCATIKVETSNDKFGDGRVVETIPAVGSDFETGQMITLVLSKVRTPEPSISVTQSPSPKPNPSPSQSPSQSSSPKPSSRPSAPKEPTVLPSAPSNGGGGIGDIDVADPTPVPAN